jgi:hypothetical protein
MAALWSWIYAVTDSEEKQMIYTDIFESILNLVRYNIVSFFVTSWWKWSRPGPYTIWNLVVQKRFAGQVRNIQQLVYTVVKSWTPMTTACATERPFWHNPNHWQSKSIADERPTFECLPTYPPPSSSVAEPGFWPRGAWQFCWGATVAYLEISQRGAGNFSTST